MNEAEKFLNRRRGDSMGSFASRHQGGNVQKMASVGDAWSRFWSGWTIQGRASRSEYWFAALLIFLMNVGILWILAVIEGQVFANGVILLLGLLTMFVIEGWPGLCIDGRRLHDVGKSALHLLVPYIGIGLMITGICLFQVKPYFGVAIVITAGVVSFVYTAMLLVFTLLKSTSYQTKYGDVPFLKDRRE